MIDLTYDVTAGTVKVASAATIKAGAGVPVRVTFSAAPGSVSGLALALGRDGTPARVLAYTDAWSMEGEGGTVYTAVLDASDSRLLDFMSDKGATNVVGEVRVTLDGTLQITPNFPLTVQPAIVMGPATSEGGPVYWTSTQVTAALPDISGLVPKTRTVAGHALTADVALGKSDVGLGNVENTALSTWAGSANLTTLGTIASGTWHGTAIADNYIASAAAWNNKAPAVLTPVTLSYASALTPAAGDGLARRCTLTGDATLNAPTGGADGMRWEGWFIASGGDRTLTVSGAILRPSDSTFSGTKTLTSGKTYVVLLKYNGTAWMLASLVGGF